MQKALKSLSIENIITILGIIIMLNVFGILPIQAQSAALDEFGSDYAKQKETATIFIGDSRTVLMDAYLDLSKTPDTFVIAKNGEGFEWLQSNALPELEKITKQQKYQKYNIVMLLGVNDPTRVDDYIKALPVLEQYGTVYFVSINPVQGMFVPLKGIPIDCFNKKMSTAADRYIDCNTYLKNTGFMEPDDIHYEEYTCKKMYAYIMLNIYTWEFLEESTDQPVTKEQVKKMLNNL